MGLGEAQQILLALLPDRADTARLRGGVAPRRLLLFAAPSRRLPQQLFRGDTVSDILASVLKEEPDFRQVPEKVRPLLKR